MVTLQKAIDKLSDLRVKAMGKSRVTEKDLHEIEMLIFKAIDKLDKESLTDKMFNLANELAVAKHGNEAVILHDMHNKLIKDAKLCGGTLTYKKTIVSNG